MFASAMEVTCGRYICERGACAYLGSEITLLNRKKAYILGSRHALEAALPRIESSLKAENIDHVVSVFSGYCTFDNANKHAAEATAAGCDIIIGVGGGKCIDTAKAVGKITRLPLGNIPTQLATCVACTNMAIMYENSGAFVGPLYPDLPIAFVLADLDILVTAPERFIASGIADSMAKFPELYFSSRGTANCREIDDAAFQSAQAMAVGTWNTLKENGFQAYCDNINRNISNEYSAVVNANLVLTGVISGLARGSKQLAIAHAVYNNSTTVFPETWRTFLHGEIVSVGLMLQQYYNNSPENEIQDYLTLCRKMSVPVCLRDIGIQGTPDELDKLHTAIAKDFSDLTDSQSRKLRADLERIVVI